MAAADLVRSNLSDAMLPAGSAAATTGHDTTELTAVTRSLYVGGAGNLTVLMADGTTCTFTAVAAGTILPIRVRRVNLTNLTASNIVALW
jgi:hypothetical protein